MDIDENLLIAEVGRKRMASTGDREAEEFVRRQSAVFVPSRLRSALKRFLRDR